MPIDVSAVPCSTYTPDVCRRSLEQVLKPLGGLNWVQPGMRVAIKANLVAGMAPERAATTHPALWSSGTAPAGSTMPPLWREFIRRPVYTPWKPPGQS